MRDQRLSLCCGFEEVEETSWKNRALKNWQEMCKYERKLNPIGKRVWHTVGQFGGIVDP